ncbi:cysteine desulfurase family protein [Protaetiibacter mangrovi]|uniref:Cysteine desulfurase n=1 Tax=Protaetiibacter mangrovi TaxID=2970926 RepID=A0ABT1ZII7_9MICO|nr:cysteine desulfurase family protein [Protaetiibacter mangrovi]MCS0500502.1 cysteine desulfurase [Protaetiibacter mangrovi]TPX02693.1 cysteine desulfurase [Schumannella luteola]
MAVYLDHAATSPMPDEVLAAYTDALRLVGNPSSIHGAGQAARELLETGREELARALDADPVEVVLTSGGTESINLAVKGMFWAARAQDPRRSRVLVPRGEHHATLDAVEWLARHEGAQLEWIELDAEGRIRLDALDSALAAASGEVALVTALWANNEVGTLQPVAELVALAHAHGVPVHLDAVSAFGQVPVRVHEVEADAVSVSAHKVGGPVGVGALVLARTATVEPLLHGGDQQRGRSGTQDAAGAAAFAVAASRAVAEVPLTRVAALRDRLVAGVLATVDGAVLRGAPGEGRLPGNAHFTFAGADGDALLYLLDASGIAVSTGSACQAGVPELSHVLIAMGVPEPEARGALRITLGHDSGDADVDAFLAALPAAVAGARAAASAS